MPEKVEAVTGAERQVPVQREEGGVPTDTSPADASPAGAALLVAADALRKLRATWLDAGSPADRARQEFAELLLRREIQDLRPPPLPGALECSARLTAPMVTAWHMRRDLQDQYDLSSVGGYFGLLAWFVQHGRSEHPEAQATLLAALPELASPWPGAAGGEGLTQFACALWLSRPDLQANFPITAAAGRAAYADWFLRKGVVECRAWPVLSAAQMDWLLQLEPPVAGDTLPVARFLLSTWALRPDLRERLPLGSARWGARLWTWFLEEGVVDLGVHPELVRRSVGLLDGAGVRITWS